jgi:hypothetical protein
MRQYGHPINHGNVRWWLRKEGNGVEPSAIWPARRSRPVGHRRPLPSGEEMPNGECQMPNGNGRRPLLHHSALGIRHSALRPWKGPELNRQITSRRLLRFERSGPAHVPTLPSGRRANRTLTRTSRADLSRIVGQTNIPLPTENISKAESSGPDPQTPKASHRLSRPCPHLAGLLSMRRARFELALPTTSTSCLLPVGLRPRIGMTS